MMSCDLAAVGERRSVNDPGVMALWQPAFGLPAGEGSWLSRQLSKTRLLAFPTLGYRGRKANRGSNRWHNDQNRDWLGHEREGRLSGRGAGFCAPQHIYRRRRQPRAHGAWHDRLPPAVAGVSFAGRLRGSRMEYFLQQLINGLTLGGVYGLIAIGYTMVYGIIGMINFAHGDIYMIGAFNALICFLVLGYLGITWVPLAILIVLIVAVALTAVYGWTVERVAYRPLRGSTRLAPLISAIGMSIFLQNFVLLLQGARGKPLTPPPISGGFTLMEADGFTVELSYLQITIMLITVGLMTGFTLLITKTSLGRQQRACEQDMKMASLLGVNINRTIATTFIIGAALAAVAGLMVTLYYGVIDFYIGFVAGIKAFTAAVLGGIGSMPGAMLGGLLIGLIEVFWSAYFTVEYKDVAAFTVLVMVLIFRPTGLLGRPEIEKV
jgi:branched-chain amino acid transport system permease protein